MPWQFDAVLMLAFSIPGGSTPLRDAPSRERPFDELDGSGRGDDQVLRLAREENKRYYSVRSP